MKTLVLLGLTVGDWSGANDYRIDAEALWRIVRRWHPEGEDETVDAFITEIRKSLNELDTTLKEEELEEFDLDDLVKDIVTVHEDEVADARQ